MNCSVPDGHHSEADAILDVWIHFLSSLKGKDEGQRRSVIGEPDTYFGISTIGFQGVITRPNNNVPSGTFSMIWENGIPRHLDLTAPINMFCVEVEDEK